MLTEELTGLRKLWSGFMASRIMISANNFGIFDRLEKPRTASALAASTKTDSRAAGILLDALAGIGVITKKNGLYKNTPAASRYLVRGKPHYQGDILRHYANLWNRWSMLDDVLRTGRPAPRSGRFDHESFIMGMHNLSLLRLNDVLKAIGLKGVKSSLDLGAGPGTYSIAMAKKGISATIFDTPDTVRIARKLVRKEGAKGVKFIAGDFHTHDIGKGYDLILLSQIFHAYSERENMLLLKKCKKAINPGGVVTIHEFPLAETRTSPPHSAIFSVNMLVGTKDGRCYTPAEMSSWLSRTGFGDVKVVNLKDTVLVKGKAR